MTLPYSSKSAFFYNFYYYVMGVFMLINKTLRRGGRTDRVHYAGV